MTTIKGKRHWVCTNKQINRLYADVLRVCDDLWQEKVYGSYVEIRAKVILHPEILYTVFLDTKRGIVKHIQCYRNGVHIKTYWNKEQFDEN